MTLPPELRDALQSLALVVIGALTAYLRQLVNSRVTQGTRIGALEDRVSYLEGQLGVKKPPAPPVG